MQYVIGSQCSFFKKGGDMATSIKPKNNSAEGILNLLEFSPQVHC